MIKTIRNVIVKGMYESTGLTTVTTDSNHKKPNYPFFSYKFTTLRQNSGEAGSLYDVVVDSTSEEFDKDILRVLAYQPAAIISFNAYSDDLLECQESIIKAWEWFKLKGNQDLDNNNLVVIDMTDIQDRTVFLGEEYEYRQGFDVRVRFLHTFDNRLETIEEAKMKGEIK